MRIPKLAFAVLVGGALACVAWFGNASDTLAGERTAASRARFQSFTRDLCLLTDAICRQYYRPIMRLRMYDAPITGVYETIRSKLPAWAKVYADRTAYYTVRALVLADAIVRQHSDDDLRAELLTVGLSALYESARRPIPPNLRTDIRLACTRRRADAAVLQYRVDLGPLENLTADEEFMIGVAALPQALDPFCGLPANRDTNNNEENPFSVGLDFANAEIQSLDMLHRGREQQPRLITGVPQGGVPNILEIKSVIPGSPAQKANLRPRDQIIRIDGKPCPDIDPARFYGMFYPQRSPFSSRQVAHQLSLEVRRPGTARTFTTSVRAAAFNIETIFGVRRQADGTWEYLIDDTHRLGYIRVGQIAAVSSEQFFQAMNSLTAAGAKGLIIDLRWCPGGYLGQAVGITRSLLPEGKSVARVANMQGVENANDDFPFGLEPIVDLPVVVLVNGDTMGGGELIAAALQDHGRAIIVGSRTFGKASVQRPLDFANSSRLAITFKVTQGVLKRPSGKNLQRFSDSKLTDDWGVQPDSGKTLPISNELSNQLKEWWTWQSLRPANVREALPTDDPDADPQLRAAVAILRGIGKKES